MKIYIYILLVLMLSVSCSDFLDKEPEKTLPFSDMDYTKTENMYQVVSGTYSYFNSYMTAWRITFLMYVRGDDTDKGGKAADQAALANIEAFRYGVTKDSYILTQSWLDLHQIVIIANEAMLSLDMYNKYITKPEDKKLYDQYMGELRLLRAYTYMFLSNTWGAIPLITDNEQLKQNPPKASVEEIRQFILNEMAYCAGVLPAQRPNQNIHKGAVTKYTALAISAKVHFYNKDYQKAKEVSNEIINSNLFELYDDYYQLFKIPAKLCNESLYEAQFSDLGNSSGEMLWTDNWHYSQGPLGNEGIITGWGFLTPSKKLVDLLTARGETVRKKTMLLPANSVTEEGDIIGSNSIGVEYWAGKPYTPVSQMTPGRDWYGDNNNIRMLRYADILLINAESKVRTGENGDVPLNLVRKRAKMPEISGATADQILEERFIELGMEWGERFYDLVRTDKAAQELPGFVPGTHEYLPIPQSQIDLNSNLRY